MKLNFALFGFLFLFGCVAEKREHRLTSNYENITRVHNSVISLFKRKETTGEVIGPVCTGFFVSETIIITAFHCIRQDLNDKQILAVPFTSRTFPIMSRAQFVSFARSNGEVIETYETAVMGFDEESDIAVLELMFDVRSESYLRFSDAQILEGQEVYSLGMPRGQPWVITRGMVSSVHPSGHRYGHIIHQAFIAPGSSGGPLLDDNGFVVGLNIAFVENATYLAVAVPIQKINVLLDSLNI